MRDSNLSRRGFFSVDPLTPIEQVARKNLDLALATVQTQFPLATAVLRKGPAAAEILSALDEVHADLVITGTHGRHGVSRTILGSVAERVVRLSPVPVLVAHRRSGAHPQ